MPAPYTAFTFGDPVPAPAAFGKSAFVFGDPVLSLATLKGPAAPLPPPIDLPGLDPQIILQCSNDGGETWGPEKQASLGKLGNYRALPRWRQLGRSNNRCFRVICSEPVQVAIISADLDAEAADR